MATRFLPPLDGIENRDAVRRDRLISLKENSECTGAAVRKNHRRTILANSKSNETEGSIGAAQSLSQSHFAVFTEIGGMAGHPSRGEFQCDHN